jgi:hypothetical protein
VLIIDDTTGRISRLGNGGIPVQGTNTTGNASVGDVGEYVESTVLLGSSVTGFVTNTPKDITSISLAAGDWDVTGNVGSNPTAGAVQGSYIGWISSTSATLPDFTFTTFNAQTQSANVGLNQSAPKRRLSLSTTTTVYLSAQLGFAGGSMSAYGTIQARRMR